jgi:Flp pilus assembly protein TadG
MDLVAREKGRLRMRMRMRMRARARRGAALVEAAVMLTLLLTLIFGIFELGIALFRNHVACEAARQGARVAIVHGYLAPVANMNAWGPTPASYPALTARSLYASTTSYTVQADDPSDELAGAIRPYLVGLDPGAVTLAIGWPDGDNEPGHRVTVSVTTSYRHPIAFLFGGEWISLAAASTMTVAH